MAIDAIIARLDYFRLVSRRIPTLPNKFRQLRESSSSTATRSRT